MPVLFLKSIREPEAVGELVGGNPNGAVLQIGRELGGIAGGRKAGSAGADDGKGFVSGEMRKRFFQGAGESGEWSPGSDA